MKPQLERVEVEAAGSGDDDLPVQNARLRDAVDQRRVQFRKIPIERAQIAALDVHVGRAAEDDGAKAVPLRFVEEAAALGQFVGKLREHRLDRRRQRKHRRHNSNDLA